MLQPAFGSLDEDEQSWGDESTSENHDASWDESVASAWNETDQTVQHVKDVSYLEQLRKFVRISLYVFNMFANRKKTR